MSQWLWVGLGGMLGALVRFSVAKLLSSRWHHPFPLPTFLVNMLGAFLLGRIVHMEEPALQLFLGAGSMGALTTFSTFMVEGYQLAQQKKMIVSFLYLIGSIGLGLLLAFLSYHA